MLVVEKVSGTRLPELVGTLDAPRVGTKLGEALAALQREDADIEKTYLLEDDLRSLHGHVTKLGEVWPDLRARAGAVFQVFQTVAECCGVAAEQRAPTLRALPLDHIFWQGDRIAVGQVKDIALSHPLIDVGDLLARLTLFGIESGNAAEAAELADHFLSAYAANAGTDLEPLAAFQAGALLRLVCRDAGQPPRHDIAEHLLQHAEVRLALA